MVARKTLPSSLPQQERLHTLIQANPGIHIRRLSQLMGVSWNTCLHHLRSMEAQGRVLRRKVQGRVCYFDRTNGAVQGKEAVCLLRDPHNRRVARQVLSTPGNKQIELARRLGMATSTLHRRITRLEDAGLVTRIPGDRSMRVFPAETLPPMARDLGLVQGEDLFAPLDAPARAPAHAVAPAPTAPVAPAAPSAAPGPRLGGTLDVLDAAQA